MNDLFIKNLFADVMKRMQLDTEGLPASHEYSLMIDEQYPVLLRYDAPTERVMLIGSLDTQAAQDPAALRTRILRAGLNPLRTGGPGVGLDEESGLYFSYATLPRMSASADSICREMIALVEWGKRLVADGA
nr:CesT family type III secretion system chaperone [uncultured Pseudomonas sp.]